MLESFAFEDLFISDLILKSEEKFEKWIKVELDFALGRLDTLASSPDSWKIRFQQSIENDKIPVIADLFVNLLKAITEYYRDILFINVKKDIACRLQKPIIFSFIEKLNIQMDKSMNDKLKNFCMVCNSARFVFDEIESWKDDLLFLSIDENDFIFNDCLSLLNSTLNQVALAIVDLQLESYKSFIRPFYRKRRLSFNEIDSQQSIADILLEIQKFLDSVGQFVEFADFKSISRSLVSGIENDIIEFAINPFHLNFEEAAALNKIIVEPLTSLFANYSSRYLNKLNAIIQLLMLLPSDPIIKEIQNSIDENNSSELFKLTGLTVDVAKQYIQKRKN
ncbi:hypothetical protein ROZALSC1DRAFT_31816 [Rozella allomycis CSF55]|nr:hypothetical protein ROZALSC1DRAFT_31816 [Rozella allomycis CSF55]